MKPARTNLGSQLARGNGGYELVLAGVLLGFLGWWIDGKVGTRPLFMLALGVVGFVGSGMAIYYRFKNGLVGMQTVEAVEQESSISATSDEAP